MKTKETIAKITPTYAEKANSYGAHNLTSVQITLDAEQYNELIYALRESVICTDNYRDAKDRVLLEQALSVPAYICEEED